MPVLILVPAHGQPWRRGAGRAALVGVVVLATVAPTAWSNAQRHGRWVIADSALFNLWVGLSEVSRRNFVDEIVGREFNAYVASAEGSTERNRILAGKLRALVRERGGWELLRAQLGRQYFRLLDKDSFFTDQLARGAIHVRGAGYAFSTPALAVTLRGICYAAYGLLLVAAPFGLLLCPPAQRRRMWLLLLFLAYNLLLFLLVHVKSRYRIQLLPVLFLLAGCAVQFRSRRRPSDGSVGGPHRWQWAAAGAVSALLLGLAFAGPWMD